MSYDKNKLVSHLKRVFEFSTPEANNPLSLRRQIVLGGSGDEIFIAPEGKAPLHFAMPEDSPPGITIYDEGCDALDQFVNEVLKDQELSTLVAPDAVSKTLTSLVSEIGVSDRAGIDYDSLLKERILKPLKEGIRTWRVMIPLINVTVNRPIAIGKTTLVPYIDGCLQNVDVMNGHEFGGNAEKAQSDKFCFLQVVNDIAQRCSSWAATDVRAHASRIEAVATEQVEGALNVIRSFVHAFYVRELKCTFGMLHEISGAHGAFIADTNRESINISFLNRNALARFDITDQIIRTLKDEWCFDILSSICAIPKNDRTSLQTAIYVANHWLGRSGMMMTREDALTACTVALERLLILDCEQATTDKFAERLAYLLSSNGDERQDINKIAKRLYDVRSKIVHAGYRGIAEADFVQIECFAMHGIAKAAKLANELREHKDLIDWFNKHKFS